MRPKDFLVGCGLGCLGLVVAGVASCVGFRMWLDSPGELLEARRLLGRDTTGYAEVLLSLDDPGTARFVDGILEATGPKEIERLPDWVQLLLQLQQRRRARQVREMFPMVIAWTMTPGSTAEVDEHLLSVSTERMGNRPTLVRWFLSFVLRRSGDGEIVEYRGRTLVDLEERGEGAEAGPTLLLERGQFHIGFGRAAAERAVDRLVDRRQAEDLPPTRLEIWFAALPSDSPLRGAITNEGGELVRLARHVLGESSEDRDAPLLAELEGLTVAAGFGLDGALTGTLELLSADAPWAVEHAAELEDLVERIVAHLHVTVAEGAEIRGDRVRFAVTLADLPATFPVPLDRPEVERAPAVETGQPVLEEEPSRDRSN